MNATLQGAFVIVAARALGFDAGPMGIYNRAAFENVFFPDGCLAALFLVALGRRQGNQPPREPRLDVEEVVQYF